MSSPPPPSSSSPNGKDSKRAFEYSTHPLDQSKGPFHLPNWLQEHKKELQPPVGNALMYGKPEGEFKVMIISGPNKRTDFHIEEHEEFFYQIKGDINIRIRDERENKFKDIPVKEGEMFVLPARIPHNPQRPADTLGLVLEVERKEGELDGCRWYCEKCEQIVHEKFFFCTDLATQLKPIIEEYYDSQELRTCSKCGHTNQVPV